MSLISNTINFDDHVAGLESMSGQELDVYVLETELELEEDLKEIAEVVQLVSGLEALIDESESTGEEITSKELNLLLNGHDLTVSDLGWVSGNEGLKDIVAKMGRGITDRIEKVTKSVRDFRRSNLTILGLRRKKLRSSIEKLRSKNVDGRSLNIGVDGVKLQTQENPVATVKDIRSLLDEFSDIFHPFHDKWLPLYEQRLDNVVSTMSDFRLTDPRGSVLSIVDAIYELPFQDLIKLSSAVKNSAKTSRRNAFGSNVYIGQYQFVVDPGREMKTQENYKEDINELVSQAVSRQAYYEHVKWTKKKPIETIVRVDKTDELIGLLEEGLKILDRAYDVLDRDNAQGLGNNFIKTVLKWTVGDFKASISTGGFISSTYREFVRVANRILVWQHKPRNSLVKHASEISSGLIRLADEALK